MEEIEVPLEKSEEDIHEKAHHAKEPWIGWAALTSALLAALAAVAALQAGHHVNEAGIIQLKASDKWNEYQAKKQKSMAAQKAIHDRKEDAKHGEVLKQLDSVNDSDPLGGL